MNKKQTDTDTDADASTRAKILEESERLFADRGYDGVSIRDITQAAEVNLGAVTYHFKTKERLFALILHAKVQPLMRMGEALMRQKMPAADKLRALLETYAMHVLYTDPNLKVYFAELLAGGRRLPRETQDAVAIRNRMVMAVLKQGIREKVFRPCDMECAAWNFFGMLSGYILYEPIAGVGGRQRRYPKPYIERIVRAAVDTFLYGVMVPAATAPKGGVKRKK